MKNKRFLAGLLCTAVIFTSINFDVSAAMLNGTPLAEDTVISTEVPEVSDGLTEGTVALSDEEAGEQTVLEDEAPAEESGAEIIEEPVEAEGDIVDAEGGVSDNETPDGTDLVDVDDEDDVSVEQPEEAVYPSTFLSTEVISGKHVLCLSSASFNSIDEALEYSSDGAVVIPKETDVIPKSDKLFYGASRVKDVQFESDIVSGNELVIAEEAFANSSVEKFIARDDYETVEKGTFQNCAQLKTLDLRNVKEIKENAFNGCLVLGSKTKGSTITGARGASVYTFIIGERAFQNTGFETLEFGDNTGAFTIGCDAEWIALDKHAFEGCRDLKKILIPAWVTGIPEYCFANCTVLNDIFVNGSGFTIGRYAFANCIKLTEVKNINVFKVDDYAFQGCESLKTVEFPKYVRYVGNRVFDRCEKITSVTFLYFNEELGFADWWDGIPPYISGIYISETAFPFPIPGKAVISGYDGRVEEYAIDENHKFKEYKSLVASKSWKASTAKNRILAGSNVSPASGKAKPGKPVTFKVSPKGSGTSAWRLQRDDLYDLKNTNNMGLRKSDFIFVSGDDKSQTFKFTMPFQDVEFDVYDGLYQDSTLKSISKIDIGEYEGSGRQFNIEGDEYVVDKAGYKGQILIDAKAVVNKQDKTILLGPWMFNYTSSDPKVATVDAKGVVTAKSGDGYTIITATYKTNKKLKATFKVHVLRDAEIEIFELKYDDKQAPNTGNFKNGAPVTRYIDGIRYENIPVVEIDRNWIETKDGKFGILLKAAEKTNPTSYLTVGAKWAVGNPNMVTLASKSNDTNKNTVTIKKGTQGETYVRASYNTHRKDEDGNKIILYAYLIVRSVDRNPRVTAGNITVDINYDNEANGGGALIDVIPYDGLAINWATVRLQRGNGKTTMATYNELKLIPDGTFDSTRRRLIVNGKSGLKPGESKVYTGKDKIWIVGAYKELASGEKIEFKTPISKLTVTNKPLELKAGKTGSINLYYNTLCYIVPYSDGTVDEVKGHYEELPKKSDTEKDVDYNKRYIAATVGEVKVTNNIKKKVAEVENVQLWTAATYKKWLTDKKPISDNALRDPKQFNDKLTNNFDIYMDPNNTQNFIIRRSDNPLEMVKNAGKMTPVKSGYLAVYFKGYTLPAVQKFGVPVKNKAPKYKLKQSSVKENTRNKQAEFRINVINKKKKTVLSQDSISRVYVLSANRAVSAFEGAYADGEDIVFRATNGPKSGTKTAVIAVERMNWDASYIKEYPVTYKYKVKYITKNPKAKLTPATVKVNKWYSTTPVETELVLDQMNCRLSLVSGNGLGGEFKYVGKSKLAQDAKKISLSTVSINGYQSRVKIVVSINDIKNPPAKGTYKFEFTPQYRWNDTRDVKLKKKKISVKILDNQPVIKLSTGKFTFNTNFPGLEDKNVFATFKNLPKGTDIKKVNVDMSTASWNLVNKKSSAAAIAELVSDGMSMQQKGYNTKKKKQELIYSLSDNKLVGEKFSLTYKVSGIKINGVPAKTVKITVKGIIKQPTVNTSKSGDINTIDYTSYAKYKTKFKGLTNPHIKRIIVLDDTTSNDNIGSKVLVARQDPDKPEITRVYWKHSKGEELFNENHEFVLRYVIKEGDTDKMVDTPTLKLKPVQKVPMITVNKKITKFYAGVSSNKCFDEVDITKTSELKTHITRVKVSDTNAAELQNAFNIYYVPFGADYDTDAGWYDENYDPADPTLQGYELMPKTLKKLRAGRVYIHCVAPELLVKGQTYDLVLETESDGQFIKRDKDGNIVYEKYKNGTYKYRTDDKGNKVKIPVLETGSTFTVPVVVYK